MLSFASSIDGLDEVVEADDRTNEGGVVVVVGRGKVWVEWRLKMDRKEPEEPEDEEEFEYSWEVSENKWL
jgi:hypothetical protein